MAPRLLVLMAVGVFLALAGDNQANFGTVPASSTVAALPSGANLFIVPMEWNLDEHIRAEVRRKGLPLNLVERQEDADFIMTGSSEKLGSRLVSPSRDFQVKIVAAASGTQIWSAAASDYALFFAGLRPHGSSRAARAIVLKMRHHFFKPVR